jgi:hypothetical protein
VQEKASDEVSHERESFPKAQLTSIDDQPESLLPPIISTTVASDTVSHSSPQEIPTAEPPQDHVEANAEQEPTKSNESLLVKENSVGDASQSPLEQPVVHTLQDQIPLSQFSSSALKLGSFQEMRPTDSLISQAIPANVAVSPEMVASTQNMSQEQNTENIQTPSVEFPPSDQATNVTKLPSSLLHEPKLPPIIPPLNPLLTEMLATPSLQSSHVKTIVAPMSEPLLPPVITPAQVLPQLQKWPQFVPPLIHNTSEARPVEITPPNLIENNFRLAELLSRPKKIHYPHEVVKEDDNMDVESPDYLSQHHIIGSLPKQLLQPVAPPMPMPQRIVPSFSPNNNTQPMFNIQQREKRQRMPTFKMRKGKLHLTIFSE